MKTSEARVMKRLLAYMWRYKWLKKVGTMKPTKPNNYQKKWRES